MENQFAYTCRHCGRNYVVGSNHNSEVCRHCGKWSFENCQEVLALRAAAQAGNFDPDSLGRAVQTVLDICRNHDDDQVRNDLYSLLNKFGVNSENTVF
jgi:predicted  nucleic acid-binding Zn-ribbon protein